MKRTDATGERSASTSIGAWVRQKEASCYVCDHFNQIYGRYLDTFLTYTKITMNFGKCFMKARDFVSRTSAT